jgi:hypothetical protein
MMVISDSFFSTSSNGQISSKQSVTPQTTVSQGGVPIQSRWRRWRSPVSQAMEARWISVLVGGRALPPVLGVSFFVFRVKVCRDGAQVVVAAPRAIRSPRLQPHLNGNTEKLVGVVWSSKISSGCGIFRSSRSFIGSPSSSWGRMWSSWPVRRLSVRNQQRQADSGRSASGGALLIQSGGWRWRVSQGSRCNFYFS